MNELKNDSGSHIRRSGATVLKMNNIKQELNSLKLNIHKGKELDLKMLAKDFQKICDICGKKNPIIFFKTLCRQAKTAK